ncbi:hypothetical protein [Sphingomonas kyeonggiensis]|uniref:Uncharacterized protein n=1 Tax=Sphingomonas kyeonggiensis TaxID=1268553 RepID=A0A7W6NWQ2_9SPHN|nr:hypothetical protein [Sphingomonas kyeonggiensis]MBB4099349.1 hypothetical protein [Sphingomonas kyeonggiensis]
MSWVANLVIVAVLPTRLGLLGAPLWFFMAYAVVAGCVLALIDSVGFARDICIRPDVLVRIMIVVVGGLVPFTIGHAIW